MNRMSPGIVLVFCSASVLLGCQSASETQEPDRASVIRAQAAQNPHATILIGDELVEFAAVPQLCGKPVLNAGVSGAKAANVAPLIQNLLQNPGTDLIIISVGKNDAAGGTPTSISSFKRSLSEIVEVARRHGVRVAVMGLTQLRGRDVAPQVNLERLEEFQQILREPGRNVAFIPSPVLDTDDGLMPNTAGYRRWIGAVGQACSAAKQPRLSRSI